MSPMTAVLSVTGAAATTAVTVSHSHLVLRAAATILKIAWLYIVTGARG